jgi:60 kDa SS-A/Ro ribonucleoprotein
MVNRSVFPSRNEIQTLQNLPTPDTLNEAGGAAYTFTAEHALAQIAMTGCTNDTYYVSAQDQVQQVKELAEQVSAEFLAKLAMYSRTTGGMKDMPAILLGVLKDKDPELMERVFTSVIDNTKMLRNFVTVIRSGVLGTKSFGGRLRRLTQQWFDSRTDSQLFEQSIGGNPSIGDILKIAHLNPRTEERRALYGWFLGKDEKTENLPPIVRHFEEFKNGTRTDIPKVPFEMLTSLPLNEEQWRAIARSATWNQIKKNINTFARHGVFEDEALANELAEKLRSHSLVRASKVFPYEIFVAYKMTKENSKVPWCIVSALQDALAYSVENIPQLTGKIVICVDTSGSMRSPITGVRKGATTTVTCVDAAAVFTSEILKRNPEARVMLFDTELHKATLNPHDSIATNAEYHSGFGGGGTACQIPLQQLNAEGAKPDLVIYFSDNASWVSTSDSDLYSSTEMLGEWTVLKMRNPNARLVCVDLQPNRSTQALDRDDIMNVGGFADAIFTEIEAFTLHKNALHKNALHKNGSAALPSESSTVFGWVEQIRSLELPYIQTQNKIRLN